MDEAAGTAFGQYELVSRIGRGGMGETWKARRRDVANAPFVVIKRILPQFADDPMFVESFVNEAHVTASLTHPNIAHVLDFGQVNGEYFFVIEYVHGRTIEGLLHAAAEKGFRTLPLPVACYLTLELLEGLQYAHTMKSPAGRDLRVVHRDISPDNVLIGFDGQVKVVDFGVAQAQMSGREETEAGIVKGKWPYFSPEQARAEELDGRSDLFAVGVTLYRMVCGRLPFEGTQLVAVHKMLKADYPPPQLVNESIPTILADCIARALEMKKEKRFQAAENMQTALRTVLKATAPEFNRAELRAFVHWCFENELPAEGIRSQVPATFRGTFETWQARAATTGAGEREAAVPLRTSMRVTQLAGTGLAPRVPRKRNWIAWAGGTSFLVGIAAVVFLALPDRPDAARQRVEQRRADYARATELMSALESTVSGHSKDFRARYIQVGELVDDLGVPDESFAQVLGQFEGDLQRAHSLARVEAERMAQLGDAGVMVPAVPSLSAGSKPIRLIRPVDRVPFSVSTNLILDLERHNLADLRAADEELFAPAQPSTVNFPPVSETSGPYFAFSRLASGAYRTTLVDPWKSTVLKQVASLRAFDFMPFRAKTRFARPFFLTFPMIQPPPKIQARHVSSDDGGWLLVTNVPEFLLEVVARLGATRVRVPFEVIATCDDSVALVAPTARFARPDRCAFAVLAPPGSRGTVNIRLSATAEPVPEPYLPQLVDTTPSRLPPPPKGFDDGYTRKMYQDSIAAYRAGLAAFRRRDYKTALQQFQGCAFDYFTDCHLLTAVAYGRLGQRDAALSSYRGYLTKYPKDSRTHDIKGVLERAGARY